MTLPVFSYFSFMKIVLREWEKEDIEALLKLANNRKVSDNLRIAFLILIPGKMQKPG